MDIEKKQKILKHIKDFQLKQYGIVEKIQLQLLDQNKFLQENKPYLDKMFFNEDTQLDNYVNEYGYLITFTDKYKTEVDKTCPDNKIRQGQELYAYSKEGSVLDTGPMCSIYGKNIKDSKTNDISWVDIEGYKHEYRAQSWNERDLSCKEPVLNLSHQQYTNIPTSEYSMNKERACMKTTVNPALIYELKSLNEQFIHYLETIKGDSSANSAIAKMIESIQKQNMSIVQTMNQDQSIASMLQDSVVKKDMFEYQFISWSLVTVLCIGLISHFGKKKL
jgi:hypothetical protein